MTDPRQAAVDDLVEALREAAAHLVGMASAYQKYARRYSGITPKAMVDPFFSTRVADFDKAAVRARAALAAWELAAETENSAAAAARRG